MTNRINKLQQLFMEGSQLLQIGNAAEALLRFQAAQKIDPLNATLYLYTGAALYDLGHYEKAVDSYQHAIDSAPEMGEAHNNLGNTLIELGRFVQAADSFSRAVDLLPTSPVPLTARATVLQALGKVAEAEADCRRALALDPSFAAAHWNLALNLLLQGRYDEGWREYEWRWQKPDFTSPPRHTDIPLWDGSSLNGCTILLHAEQGFGDAIQFVRYAPLVAQRGGTVVIECHPQLVSLFKGMESVTSVVAFGEKRQAYDYQAPFLSLPRIFGTTLDNIPGCPTLLVPIEKSVHWKQSISQYAGLKVGIVWSGSSIHRNDNFRSLPLTALAPFAKCAGINFFSLQIGDANRQLKLSPLSDRVIDLTDQIRDFADTAALINQLDLVISIDTAVVHLAGTLGKPVWLLLSYSPDWRWMLERNDSPWYPIVHLFRQKEPGNWGGVIDLVCTQLIKSVDENNKSFEIDPKDYITKSTTRSLHY